MWSIDTVLVPRAPRRPPPRAPLSRPPPRVVPKSLNTLVNGQSMFAQAAKKNSLPPVNWRWVEEGDGIGAARIAGLAQQLTATSFKGTVLVPSDDVSGILMHAERSGHQ